MEQPNQETNSQLEQGPREQLTYYEIMVPEEASEAVRRESLRLKGVFSAINLIKVHAVEASKRPLTIAQLERGSYSGLDLPLLTRLSAIVGYLNSNSQDVDLQGFLREQGSMFFYKVGRISEHLNPNHKLELQEFIRNEQEKRTVESETGGRVVKINDEDKKNIYDLVHERILTDLRELESGTVRDQEGNVTDYKYIQKQSTDLEELDSWRELSREVAHDIRTPIAPIKTAFQMVEKRRGTEEFEKIAEVAVGFYNDRLSALVAIAEVGVAQVFEPEEELLKKPRAELSRLEKERLPEFTLDRLKLLLYTHVGAFLEHRDVKPHLPKEMPQTDQKFYITPVEVVRFVNNMVNNALLEIDKRTAKEKTQKEAAGEKYQETEQNRQVWCEVSVPDDQSEFVFTLSDTGLGLDPEIIRTQELPEGKSTHGGEGLGTVRIMRNLRKKRGAKFSFANNEHGGATIRMKVPAIAASLNG